MSNYFYAGHAQQQAPQHAHHALNPHPLAVNNGAGHAHGRSRRAMRLASAQTGTRQYRQQQQKMMAREPIITEPPSITAFRACYEAGRSFDLNDDLEFCPVNLLTFDERHSVTSSSSDRSSLGSTSPESSPLQMQIQPQVTPAVSLSATYAPPPPPTSLTTAAHVRLHQPAALRGKNVIPIVNPSTGNRIASPPSSGSPNTMPSATTIRRW